MSTQYRKVQRRVKIKNSITQPLMTSWENTLMGTFINIQNHR